MKSKRLAGIVILILIFTMGCSGTKGKLKTQSESESKVTQQKLIKNWSDYDIWLYYSFGYPTPELLIIIFDIKNDDKEILVESNWSKVTDQQMWTEVVKKNTTSDGEFKILRDFPEAATSTVKEIWGFDSQLYGYAIISSSHFIYPRMVEENTVRLDVLGRAGGSYR